MFNIHPHRRRWIIVGLIFCAIVLNYFDRQIVSVLKPTIKHEFQLNDRGYALLINIFSVCYASMYPVAGWLVDRFGARWIMLTGILGWGSACLGAGLTRLFVPFACFRGMLGLAEPLAFPAQLRVVTIWFPAKLRATANSLSVGGSSIGAIIAPPLVAWLALKFNWHMAFILPGVVGLGVAWLWWLIYRDPPPEVAREAADSDAEGAVRAPAFAWGRLWRTRSLWGILLCRFVSDPVWYFCLFWLPGYLQERSGLTLAQIGMVGWIPFLASDLGGIGSSMWSDRMVRRGVDPLRARKIMLTAVTFLTPVCMLTPYFPHPAVTLLIFCVVGAAALSWLFTLCVVIAEAFPRGNIGSVMGISAGFGAAGAIVFNTYVGRVMETVGSARLFTVMAFLHPLAALLLWVMVRPERPSEAQPGESVPAPANIHH